MKIGIIGATSSIAAKAYLPIYASLQAEHDLTLYSRNLEAVENLRKSYGFAGATGDLSRLESSDLVFIHAATLAHFELAKRFLLAGIPVVLDKPISENFDEVQELYRLAAEKELLFMIAFNRRFAPMTQLLKEIPAKNFIKVTKNLARHQGDTQFQLYDIFIHSLDTLLYLLDEEIINWNYRLLKAAGKLQQVLVTVETATSTGLASMNLNAGAYEEVFEVEAETGTYRLKELTELEEAHGLIHSHIFPNAWNSATKNRGFDEIVTTAIAAIRGEKADLRQKNVLKSHEIIAEITRCEGARPEA